MACAARLHDAVEDHAADITPVGTCRGRSLWSCAFSGALARVPPRVRAGAPGVSGRVVFRVISQARRELSKAVKELAPLLQSDAVGRFPSPGIQARLGVSLHRGTALKYPCLLTAEFSLIGKGAR